MKTYKEYIFLKKYLALLTLFCIILCGCTSESVQTAEEAAVPAMVTTAVNENEPSPYPVTINDSVIEKTPEKVVCLSPYLTEIVYEMGYGETLVGRGSYCDYPEKVLTVTDVGKPTKPDLSTIIELKPDILLTASAIPTKDIYRLEEAGITTVCIANPDSLEKLNRVYSAMGLIYEGIFDGEAAGNKAFSSISSVLETVKKADERFVYITEGLCAAGGDTLESSVLSYFRTNAAEEGTGYSFNMDFLSDLQPEHIYANNIYTLDDLLADEVLSGLTAVQNGNVTFIDNTYFERPSGRITELIETLTTGAE